MPPFFNSLQNHFLPHMTEKQRRQKNIVRLVSLSFPLLMCKINKKSFFRSPIVYSIEVSFSNINMFYHFNTGFLQKLILMSIKIKADEQQQLLFVFIGK